VPIDPAAVTAGDSGRPMVQTSPHSEMATAFGRIVRQLLEPELQSLEATRGPLEKGKTVRIAIPVTQGNLSTHFGHCERFALFDVDADAASVPNPRLLAPPAHEPGVLPRWLHEQGTDVIITGGMGARAQSLFAQNNITVVLGAPAENPAQIVKSYLDGSLRTGANLCDH
jgi:predicted Fe-Mo cluster-binding NifX family protein